MAGLLSYNYEVNAGGAKMRSYYQMSGEEVLQEVNGSLEPLTNEQVREHQEQYGPNELVEGKKKTILQIFLEQYKDFLVIILIIAAVASGLSVFVLYESSDKERRIERKDERGIERSGLWKAFPN